MSQNDLASKRRRLNYYFDKVEEYNSNDENSNDDEISSFLAQYLCVLCSGFLEDSIRIIYGNFAEEHGSHQHVTAYVKKQLKFFQNAKYDDILKLTYIFSHEWGENFENFVDEEMKTSINTIVNNKNQLAHGQSSGVTYSQMKKYFNNLLKVLDFLEKQCKTCKR
jgi:hypothetical protein